MKNDFPYSCPQCCYAKRSMTEVEICVKGHVLVTECRDCGDKLPEKTQRRYALCSTCARILTREMEYDMELENRE